ncbi:MAG: ABC transporter ATP-binding protein [Candidatus Sumerlaeota bacterium]|nr:ABC transporter ATP-binding protein [Candidatus Sumerlaeota bacterium]
MPESADDILSIDRLWRRFRRWKERPRTLKDAAIRLVRREGVAYDSFWALRDVSFNVRRGEALGLCGANGSGKSTLLKVIAGIVPPTYWRVVVRGRVAAFLELGAGFHPELSGRENIALNGVIMGLSEREIARKTDSIIEFAELGEFIDSPVRTYSAGMYLRLGFAIACHVDCDLLLIDEVLAVGDAAFQQKCAAWFDALRARNVAVVLVSHFLPTLAEMCDRAVWLDGGEARAEGEARETLQRYCPYAVLPPRREVRGA